MSESWKHLKKRLNELKRGDQCGVIRIKMGCVGICRGGPILVVMPEGTWYGWCTPEAIDRIIQDHLIEGKIVEDLLIAQPKGLTESTGMG